jgi:precorrin-3B synthase
MKRGWCPGLYQPMPALDGLLIRLRPPAGQIRTQQLRCLARASVDYGNGRVDLTAQGRLQVRGLREPTLPAFVAAMVDAGLAEGDATREARRRVTRLANGDAGVARAIEAALMADTMPLAEKFDVMVGSDDAADADIMLHDGVIWVAGARRGARTQTPVADVQFLAAWLDGRRMRPLTDALGAAAIYRLVGLREDADIPRASLEDLRIGVVFGRLMAADLLSLAALGERFGDGVWQVTRHRALLLAGVAAPAALAEAAGACGFIVAADDVRWRVSACPGRGACARGASDTRDDAQALLAALPDGASLHVSGCAKGCAHAAAADFTFVGTDGGYDLVRQGRAGDAAVARGLSVAAAAALMRAA